MKKPIHGERRSAARRIRARISQGGSRFWRCQDFADLPPQAVLQTLSRLARQGTLRRVRKGLYYRPHQTVLGESIPGTSDIAKETLRAPMHPAGLTAANLLGFTTQNPGRAEFATSADSSPATMPEAWMIYTRRPSNRAHLSEKEGALLEFLRSRARWSDLSPDETRRRLLALLRESDTDRLVNAATKEPPRVRAMLGALGEELNLPASGLSRLRKSLNPFSRFNFGPLRGLRSAEGWQAAHAPL